MWLARAAELHDRDYVSSPFRKLRLTQATSLALSAYYFMYDYPDTAHFLTPEERREVQHRLEADQSFLDDQFRMKYFWDAVRDWKIYVIMLITIGIFTPLYSFSLFLPPSLTRSPTSNRHIPECDERCKDPSPAPRSDREPPRSSALRG